MNTFFLGACIGWMMGVVLSTGIGWAAPEAPHEQSPATETITLKIEGWTCASCEKDIRSALMAVPNGSLVIAQRQERGWKSWFGDLFQ